MSFFQKYLHRSLGLGAALSLLAAGAALAAIVKDTGVRGGAAGAGAPVEGLSDFEFALFNQGKARLSALETTCNKCVTVAPGQSGGDPALATQAGVAGLKPRFNADQCVACHSQPSLGGSGGFLVPNPQDGQWRVPENPLYDLVPHRFGQTNRVPSFIQRYGPVRIARFIKKPDGTPDGAVYPLFTIVGRNDDKSLAACTAKLLPQPDFDAESKRGNVAFRIPLQMFGAGLIEALSDAEILARHAASATYRKENGILGVPNRSAAYRFGWKAQYKSLEPLVQATGDFAASMKDYPAKCVSPDAPSFPEPVNASDFDEASVDFINPLMLLGTSFARYLDAPVPAELSALAERGRLLFGVDPKQPGIGCVACHTAQMTVSEQAKVSALRGRSANLYSDLLLHHMGPALADNIAQGEAKGDMFRTPPLWGVGQRRFFLHDGRTDDLVQAIEAHAAPAGNGYPASEANMVIARYKALPPADQQAILSFLRAL